MFAQNRKIAEVTAGREHAAADQIRELVAKDDWIACSALVRRWEKERLEAVGGAKLYDIALDAMRQALADVIYPPNMCNFEPYMQIPDPALARLEQAVSTNPEDHILTAFLAQAHIDRGWVARSGGWSHEVDEAGWHGLTQSLQTASDLLSRFDAREVSSPVLARVGFQLLAAVSDMASDEMREVYRTWSDLDLRNQYAHRSFAFFVLPRWFGDYETVEREARLAAERTGSAVGMAAYASFYLSALDFEEEAIDLLDLEAFEEGLHDLVGLSEDPAAEAVRLACMVEHASGGGAVVPLWREVFHRRRLAKQAELPGMCRRLLERHLTHMPFEDGSPGEQSLREVICRLWRKELVGGHQFTFTNDGFRVFDPTA
ncbi:MAG: hypothetical protein AAGA87_16380 [Pseudomonadota bacterium]